MCIVLKNAIVKRLQDVVVLSLLSGLLYYGASYQIFRPNADAAHYQCYAVAFWQGWLGFQKLAPGQCSFIVHPERGSLTVISQKDLLHRMQQWKLPSGLIHFVSAQRSNLPYHALPYEYPWPALIPFSLGLVVPTHWYQCAFAIVMLLLVGSLYLALLHWRSRSSALAYSLYMLVGGWTTAVARFDLFPAASDPLCCHLRGTQTLELGLCMLGLGNTLKVLFSSITGSLLSSSATGKARKVVCMAQMAATSSIRRNMSPDHWHIVALERRRNPGSTGLF